MDKSNTNSEKIFYNNHGNIKTIKNLPQMKILDLSTIFRLKTWRSGQYGINNESKLIFMLLQNIFSFFYI